jgi:hypothetical protein
MIKELVLIAMLVFSVVLVFSTIPKIGKLNTSKTSKQALIYLTILVPLIGFLVVRRFKTV